MSAFLHLLLNSTKTPEQAHKILTFLVTQLEKESDKEETSPKVLALISTGIAKLLLSGMITDEKVSFNVPGL